MKSKYILYKGAGIVLTAAMLGTGLTACGSNETSSAVSVASGTLSSGTDLQVADTVTGETKSNPVTDLSQIDNTKWQYNADDNVYYQIGISTVKIPQM